MSTLTVKELSHPAGQVIKIAAGKTLDLKSQGSVTMPTGSTLQIVEASFTTQVDISTTSYVDIGLTATITPKSTSSKILVMLNVHVYPNGSGFACLGLSRGSTQIHTLDKVNPYIDNGAVMATMFKVDSPSTASAVTYKLQAKEIGSATMRVNQDGSSKMILMEIQG